MSILNFDFSNLLWLHDSILNDFLTLGRVKISLHIPRPCMTCTHPDVVAVRFVSEWLPGHSRRVCFCTNSTRLLKRRCVTCILMSSFSVLRMIQSGLARELSEMVFRIMPVWWWVCLPMLRWRQYELYLVRLHCVVYNLEFLALEWSVEIINCLFTLVLLFHLRELRF